MSAELHSIELQPTDKVMAEAYAVRMRAALDGLCALENEAMVEGFAFNYAVGFDGFGRKGVQVLSVLKRLA